MNFHDLMIGQEHPCYVIGEIGLNHNGNLDLAKKLIDISAKAALNAVKFQKRTVDILATQEILDASDHRFPSFGKTYRQVREHLEFDLEQYKELKNYAQDRGLEFMCTPFDIPAVDFLEKVGLRAYKIASHSLTNLPFLEYLAHKKRPTIASTGMCTWDEIDRLVEIFQKANCPLALMHCVSSYPQALEESNLKMLTALQKRYGCIVGYSGHELGYFPTLTSVAMGAKLIERHITIDIAMEGFDHKLSLDPKQLGEMVQGIRNTEAAMGHGMKTVTEKEWVTRRKYHVSFVSAVEIPAGIEITNAMLTLKNPGTGIPAKDLLKILGKKTQVAIPKDTVLREEMLV